jgi:molecular chaperone GrpE
MTAKKSKKTKNEKDAVTEALQEEQADQAEAVTEEESPQAEGRKEAPEETESESSDHRYLRLQAEFANFKKRTEKETEALSALIQGNVIKDFLPIVDNFKRLLAHLEDDKDKLIEGVELINKEVDRFLSHYQVKELAAENEEFDPELHEALMMQPVTDESADNKVLQVFETGYLLRDKILRHAKVSVGKAGD